MALLLVGLLVAGCSHAWDTLEPLPSGGGTGGNASVGASAATSGTGGGSAGGSSPSTGTSSSGAPPSSVASTSASGAGGSMTPESIEYVASVAACIGVDLMGVVVVDPALCEQNAGLSQMKADENDSTSGSFLSGYLRFDLDGAFAGKSVDAVTLRLVVTASANATSDHSGEIRQVAPFVESDLTTAAPPDVSVEPIGADQGPVSLSQEVAWALPTSLVTPSMPVFLRLFPRSGDGVNYWNKSGPVKPRLAIQYH